MSGHSKWHNIQQKKGKRDVQRAGTFTRMIRAISVAAKQGGKDPDTNVALRIAIDHAKGENVPKDTITRAILRGAGELRDETEVHEVCYEGYGPGGIPLVITGLTDNKTRTVAEVKHALSSAGGSLGTPGSVLWQFRHVGVVHIAIQKGDPLRESLILESLDAGAEDIDDTGDAELVCMVDPQQFAAFRGWCSAHKYPVSFAELQYIPSTPRTLSEDEHAQMQRLVDGLLALEDVSGVYSV